VKWTWTRGFAASHGFTFGCLWRRWWPVAVRRRRRRAGRRPSRRFRPRYSNGATTRHVQDRPDDDRQAPIEPPSR
jgi:hypothetical protein